MRAKGLYFNIDYETAFDTLRRLAWVNWHVDVPRLHVRRSHAFGKKRLIAEFLQCDEGSHWQKIRSFPCPKATISWGSLLSCSSRAPVTRDSLSLPAEWRGKRHHQLEVFLALRQGQRWEEEQQEEEDLMWLLVDVVVLQISMLSIKKKKRKIKWPGTKVFWD